MIWWKCTIQLLSPHKICGAYFYTNWIDRSKINSATSEQLSGNKYTDPDIVHETVETTEFVISMNIPKVGPNLFFLHHIPINISGPITFMPAQATTTHTMTTKFPYEESPKLFSPVIDHRQSSSFILIRLA